MAMTPEEIKHENEVELPKRKAAWNEWRVRMIAARKHFDEVGREATRHFVPGVGITKPDLWQKAADAAKEAVKIAQEGLDNDTFTYSKKGTLEYSQDKAIFDDLSYFTKLAKQYGDSVEEARANEAKAAQKKADEEAAAALAAKKKATADKRKATIAAKKAAGGVAPVKKWAGTT